MEKATIRGGVRCKTLGLGKRSRGVTSLASVRRRMWILGSRACSVVLPILRRRHKNDRRDDPPPRNMDNSRKLIVSPSPSLPSPTLSSRIAPHVNRRHLRLSRQPAAPLHL